MIRYLCLDCLETLVQCDGCGRAAHRHELTPFGDGLMFGDCCLTRMMQQQAKAAEYGYA